jgi:hypothetical protein
MTTAIAIPPQVEEHVALSPGLFREPVEVGDEVLHLGHDYDTEVGQVREVIATTSPQGYITTGFPEPGWGLSDSFPWAWAPVGSSADPKGRHRPAYGQRVLILASKWFPERVGEVARAVGDNRNQFDGTRTVRVTALQDRPDAFDIDRWALLPGIPLDLAAHEQLVAALGQFDRALARLGLGLDGDAIAVIGDVLEPFALTVTRRGVGTRLRVEWPTDGVPGANG